MSSPSSTGPVEILPLPLGHVMLPAHHPRATGVDGPVTCVIQSHALVLPDGIIVVDTGPDSGHPVIDELYQPQVCTIIEALNRAGLDEREVAAVVNTHLHFDHCGQNHRLADAPVWVTAAETTAAGLPSYTVPEWAHIDDRRRRLSSDSEVIAPGVALLHTPGHTPGHQSVSVMTARGLELIVGQTCYDCQEFGDGCPADGDMHDDSWREIGQRSLDRLTAMEPVRAHFSHDPNIFTADLRNGC